MGGSTGGWVTATVGAAEAACCLLGTSGDKGVAAVALGAAVAGGSTAREGKTGGPPAENCVSREGKLGAAPPVCGFSGVNGSITRAGAPREAGRGGAVPLALVLRGCILPGAAEYLPDGSGGGAPEVALPVLDGGKRGGTASVRAES